MSQLWSKQLWQRFVYLWWVKAIASVGSTYGFFMVYFYLLKNPAYATHTVASTVVDQYIPFSTSFLWPYVSLWVYVSLPTALIGSAKEILPLIKGLGGTCLIGLLCFYFWPTRIDVGSHIPSQAMNGIYKVIKEMDSSGNSFPSLHVATSIFSLVWLHELFKKIKAPKWLHVINCAWCLAIVYSTMAIKQHVFWDVLGGVALACALLPIWKQFKFKEN